VNVPGFDLIARRGLECQPGHLLGRYVREHDVRVITTLGPVRQNAGHELTDRDVITAREWLAQQLAR